MASTWTTLLIFALFATSSLLAASESNFLAPLLSPLMDDICKTVGCGRGKCKISDSDNNNISLFPSYECECDPGWKQLFASDSNSTSNSSNFKFLPCVVPNCTLDFSCSEAAPPAQSKETTTNTSSILDPCTWANCGGGVCNKTSGLTYTCICNDGYYNLLNNTGFPCFKECSIGGDCSNLGIAMGNKPTAPAPNLPDKSANQALVLQHKVFYGMIMLALAVFGVL